MCNLPIPTHLTKILSIDERKSNQYEVAGNLRCSCGCEKFHIYHNLKREYDDSIPYSKQVGKKVLVECSECATKYLLFDSATQGYDGFVCHDCKTASDEDLERYQCEACGTYSFEICVDIEAEDYVNAFNWIVISLKCENCRQEKELVNMELS